MDLLDSFCSLNAPVGLMTTPINVNCFGLFLFLKMMNQIKSPRLHLVFLSSAGKMQLREALTSSQVSSVNIKDFRFEISQ